MAVHTIDLTPKWDVVVRITLGVLANNEWGSEASRKAEVALYDMANILDTINREQMLTEEQHKVIQENRKYID